MSFSDEIDREIRAARKDFRYEINRQLYGGQVPPPTKLSLYRRLRSWCYWKQHYARQKLAKKVAPWLHDEW